MGLKAIASRLIKKHGREVEILRQGPGVNDGFGNQSPGLIVSYPAVAISATNAVLAEFIGGFLIGADDQRLLLSCEGLTITPQTTDSVIVDGETYRIARVSPLAPDGDPIFYDLQVRDD
jgi:hypothetical protein